MRRLFGNRLFSDSLVLFGAQIAGYLLPFIAQPYLARVLGPDNVGLVGLGAALSVYFVSVVEYGFSVTGPRDVALAQDDRDKVNRIYSTVMACKVSLLVLSALVWTVIVWSVPKYRGYWPLYAVSFLQVVGWALSPNWLLQGLQRMRLVAISDYGAKIASIGLLFVLVKARGDYITAASLQAGSFLMAALIGLLCVFLIAKVRLTRTSLASMLEAMRGGLPVFFSMVSVTVVASSNTIILGSLAPYREVGYMSMAMRLIIAIRALLNPVSSVVYPHLSKLAAQSPEAGIAFLRRQLLWIGLPFLGVSIGQLLFGPWLVRLLFGPEYAESGILLQLMALTPVVYAVSTCFGNYMLAFGYQKEWSRIILTGTVLNFALLALLLQWIAPARAVALTTTLMDVFAAGASMAVYWRKTAELRQAA